MVQMLGHHVAVKIEILYQFILKLIPHSTTLRIIKSNCRKKKNRFSVKTYVSPNAVFLFFFTVGNFFLFSFFIFTLTLNKIIVCLDFKDKLKKCLLSYN